MKGTTMKRITTPLIALAATAAAIVGLSSSPASAVNDFSYSGPSKVYAVPGKAPLPQTFSHSAYAYPNGYATSVTSLTPGVCSANLSSVTFTNVGTCTLRFGFPSFTWPGKPYTVPGFTGDVSIPVVAA